MSFRPNHALFAVILLAVAASVATSQTPRAGGVENTGATANDAVYGLARLGQQAIAAPPPTVGSGSAGDLIGFSGTDGSGTQTITLVDSRKSWMAVYHIDRSGSIRLVSSRPIEADFSLQLNVTSPLPEEIRRIGKR